ncbi:MAG: hypothetical protein IKO47_10285 [Ruminococcus sp.]|nr:hypothetical protein [Ruminococcus sp.]
MTDLEKTFYVILRNVYEYCATQAMCGGTPPSVDEGFFRYTGERYLLRMKSGVGFSDYAVPDDAANDFMDWIKQNLDEKAPPFIDTISLRGKQEYHAFANIGRDEYSLDPERLRETMNSLREKCSGPMSARECYNYLHPQPAPLEEDFRTFSVAHALCTPPHNYTLPCPPPENYKSCLSNKSGKAYIILWHNSKKLSCDIPDEVIPYIKEQLRELTQKTAEPYNIPGDWYARVQIDNSKLEYSVDPIAAIQFLRDAAGKCGLELDSLENPDMTNEERKAASPFLIHNNMFMVNSDKMGLSSTAPAQLTEPEVIPENGWKCPQCEHICTGKYCPECGSQRPAD